MKKLIAKKPCSFGGKSFFIGNEIPKELVLDPKAQESMGVLVVVEVESKEAAPEEGGPLLPPSSTLESAHEEDVALQATDKQATYTKSALIRMNKEELLRIATDHGVAADAEMKKDDIADLIIKKQEG